MTRKAEPMKVYTATPEMCHESPYSVDGGLLPSEWKGKKFRLEDGRAILEGWQEGVITSWYIRDELVEKIKASEEKPTEEAEPDIAQQLRDELQRLREVVATREEELRTFKKRVGEVAMEYADRHDWCSTVAEALDEMGIEVPAKEYEFTLSVIYRVRGTKETYGEPDTYDLRNAYLDTDVTLSPDDWRDIEVEYVQHDVMDIEEVEK